MRNKWKNVIVHHSASDFGCTRLITEWHKKERESTRLVAMESNISKLNKVLMGNGEIGLCERVRGLQKMLIPLWTLVSVIGLALLTGLVKLFLG